MKTLISAFIKLFLFVGGSIGAFLAVTTLLGLVLYEMELTATPHEPRRIAVEWVADRLQSGIDVAEAASESSD